MIRSLLAIVLGLVLALGWSLWRAEAHKGRADRAQEAVERANAALIAERAAREEGQRAVERMANIGAEHEDDRRDAESVPDAVAADLRAGNLRLRREWAGCETQRLSDAAAAARERDALAASRNALAGAVVRVGRDADDQLAACQAVIRADRGGEG